MNKTIVWPIITQLCVELTLSVRNYEIMEDDKKL